MQQEQNTDTVLELQSFPIYRKSAFVDVFYKVLDKNTIVTNNYGQLNKNSFAEYTIIELLENPYSDYADSNEAEWEANLPTN